MNGNNFEFTGRVNFINLDYSKAGNAYCRVLVSKKAGKDTNEYMTVPVMMFGKTAEEFAKTVDKGETVNFRGAIEGRSDEKTKAIEISLKAFEYTPVVYSESEKCYVPKIAAEVEKEAAKQGELPWKSK